MSQEQQESAVPSGDPTATVATASSTEPSPAPPAIDDATWSRIEMYRQVVKPTIYMIADFVWRVLLLAAAVWLIAKYLDR
jgi:hypothetical protein